jgi:hypothetical protein
VPVFIGRGAPLYARAPYGDLRIPIPALLFSSGVKRFPIFQEARKAPIFMPLASLSLAGLAGDVVGNAADASMPRRHTLSASGERSSMQECRQQALRSSLILQTRISNLGLTAASIERTARGLPARG